MVDLRKTTGGFLVRGMVHSGTADDGVLRNNIDSLAVGNRIKGL